MLLEDKINPQTDVISFLVQKSILILKKYILKFMYIYIHFFCVQMSLSRSTLVDSKSDNK